MPQWRQVGCLNLAAKLPASCQDLLRWCHQHRGPPKLKAFGACAAEPVDCARAAMVHNVQPADSSPASCCCIGVHEPLATLVYLDCSPEGVGTRWVPAPAWRTGRASTSFKSPSLCASKRIARLQRHRQRQVSTPVSMVTKKAGRSFVCRWWSASCSRGMLHGTR